MSKKKADKIPCEALVEVDNPLPGYAPLMKRPCSKRSVAMAWGRPVCRKHAGIAK